MFRFGMQRLLFRGSKPQLAQSSTVGIFMLSIIARSREEKLLREIKQKENLEERGKDDEKNNENEKLTDK